MHTDLATATSSHLGAALDGDQDRLIEESRRKDVFIATLAHELRNLICPLSCALDLLEHAGATDPQAWRRVLPVARRQVQHMSHLVNSLLDVGRMVRGEVLMEPTQLAMSSLVSETLEACAPLLSRHVVHVELATEELWVQGDPVRLSQVLTNLLHNAAKFSPPGAAISVQVERAGDQVLLHVRDAGIGIEPEHLESIFGLFMQEPRGVVQGADGLGIGLALVRRLVELHGGQVRATSGGAGRGAQFTVSLPLVVPSGAEVGSAALQQQAATFDRPPGSSACAERGTRFDAGHAGQVFVRMARRSVLNAEPPRARLAPLPTAPSAVASCVPTTTGRPWPSRAA